MILYKLGIVSDALSISSGEIVFSAHNFRSIFSISYFYSV